MSIFFIDTWVRDLFCRDSRVWVCGRVTHDWLNPCTRSATTRTCSQSWMDGRLCWTRRRLKSKLEISYSLGRCYSKYTQAWSHAHTHTHTHIRTRTRPCPDTYTHTCTPAHQVCLGIITLLFWTWSPSISVLYVIRDLKSMLDFTRIYVLRDCLNPSLLCFWHL